MDNDLGTVYMHTEFQEIVDVAVNERARDFGMSYIYIYHVTSKLFYK